MTRWLQKRVLLSLAIALAAIVVDQLTKAIAIANLHPFARVDAFGSLLGWYLTFNDSAAFSLGWGITWLFTLVSSVALLVLIWALPRARTAGWAILAGFLLGGITGNLIDRFTRAPGFPNGQVVDFIQIPFNFPIFNIADCCISITMFVVAIRMVRGEPVGGNIKDATND